MPNTKRTAARKALEFRKLDLEVQLLSLQVAAYREIEAIYPLLQPLLAAVVDKELETLRRRTPTRQ